MDRIEDARELLFTRVQALDAGNALKVMGYLLLQDWSQQDLLQLARGPEGVLYSHVMKAKEELGLASKDGMFHPGQLPSRTTADSGDHKLTAWQSRAAQSLSPIEFTCRSSLSHSLFLSTNPRYGMSPSVSFNEQWTHALPPSPFMYDKTHIHHDHPHEKVLTPKQCPAFYSHVREHDSPIHTQSKGVPTSPSLVDGSYIHFNSFSSKQCLFFSRGCCKHGSGCRFVHANFKREKTAPVFPYTEDMASNEFDECAGPYDCLEQELQQLLRGRHIPVSIASLPQLYYERFGKSLPAEGCLTESQGHGIRAGFSLSKLLMRLKGVVTLIDRPDGQHAVMLTEDVLQFNDRRAFKDDYVAVNASSRQIYLTFPPESSFAEEDVAIHFRAYGPVQDVRIPYQQKRMFGFVTFVYAETVRTVLTEDNSHYICGTRVLVKPYKERGNIGDRKLHYPERDHQLKHNLVVQNLPGKSLRGSMQTVVSQPDDLEQTLSSLHSTTAQSPTREVKQDGSHPQEQSLTLEIDSIEDNALTVDDGFSVEANNFRFVLDLLDGESEDTDRAGTTAGPISSWDSQPQLDVQFQTTDINDTVANTMHGVESHHLTSQNTWLMQHKSWGAPPLFARSVF